MRFFIWLLFATISSNVFAGLPPTTSSGQSDSSKQTTFNFIVPYNQKTNLGGVNALLETGNKNLLVNPSFENTTFDSGWTTTTATSAKEISTIFDGKQALKLSFSASTGSISQSVTPTVNTANVPYQASCWVNTTLTSIEVCGLAGGTNQNCQTVPATGTWQPVTTYFNGPANGTSVGVKVDSTSSTTGNAYVDSCYVGPTSGVGSISQSQQYGSITISGCTNASPAYSVNVTSTSTYFQFGAASGCTYTATENASQPSTQIPGATFNQGLPAATYYAFVSGTLRNANGNGSSVFSITDGTNTWSGTGGNSVAGSNASNMPGFIASHTYTSDQAGPITLKIQVESDSTANTSAVYANGIYPLTITIVKVPNSTQVVSTAAATPANWSGYHTLSGSWSITSATYADFGAGTSVALTPTKYTNMTCSTMSGSLPGITCSIPKSGNYYVCAFANVNPSAGTSSVQMVDGSNNLIVPGIDIGSTVRTPDPICGFYYAPSSGTATFKLQGAESSGTLNISQSSAIGSAAINWSVASLDSLNAAPYLANSVVSNSSGVESFNRLIVNATGAGVCSSSPCTISYQSGNWVSSVTRTATGNYTVNFQPGIFSDVPTCLVNGNQFFFVQVNTPTTSAFSYVVENASASAVDDDNMNVICMGPH